MAVYRRSSRPRFLLVLLVLTSVSLVTLDLRSGGGGAVASIRGRARDAFAPIQSATNSVVSPITDFFHGVFQFQSLKHENALLRQQLADQNASQIAAANAIRENRDLNDILNLDFVGDIPTVAARVVSGPESNFQASVVIDRGSADGLVRDMPVVAGSGLVGRLESVARHQSVVLLLTDPASNVGIRVSPSGDLAVATGQGSGKPLTVDLIDANTKVETGSVVVTSGLQQSLYPGGIPVGTVRSAVTRPGALQQAVSLDPVVDIGRVTFVKVLLWSPQ